MPRFVRPPGRFLAILCVAAGTAIVRAEETNPALATAYNQAMAEFQAGHYAKAASALEALAARVEATPQVEPIFYTIGSAYFNAGNFSKAIAAFTNYQRKFPNGLHASGAAFAIAESNLRSKNYKEAAVQMAALENNAQMREQALLSEAKALKAAGKAGDAIRTLEKLTNPEIRTAIAMRGATMLAQLYAEAGDGAKALRTLAIIHQKIALADNIIELNALTVDLGDKFYKEARFKEALACYRCAYPREQIIRLQSDRILQMQRRIEENLAGARTNPAEITRLAPANNQLKENIANAQKLLVEFEKAPSITPAIYLRLARSFYELDRKWEAVVVDQEIVDRFKEAPEREPALFSLIVALTDVNQGRRAGERCEQYLREFENGPNAAAVAYLSGVCALQAGNALAAEICFGRLLETQLKSPFREQIRYLSGNAKFAAGSYGEAVAAYKTYLNEFPQGASAEEVSYRIALCALYAGKYQEAMNQLQDYAAKHPGASYLPDAKYRLAVCKYAASLYDEVLADCEAWEKQFPNNPQLGEVLALRADAYAASERESAAIPLYIRSYETAATDEIVNYSLFAASKLLQKQHEWDKVAELFARFIKEKPDSATVVPALYWIGKAKAHEGKIDEAKQLSAETIKKYIADPNREAVEQLITQLAQLCAKKKQPGENARIAAAPADEAGVELDRLLSSSPNERDLVAKARILFAKAELARFRDQPEEEQKNIAQIASEFKPEQLSPLLLGEVADHLLSKGEFDRATEFYQRLFDDFAKSETIDYAYNGLGQIAYQKQDFSRALRYFTEGAEKVPGAQKLKEISLGRARTLLALGKLDEAEKAFEQVASVREWRGEATACSVYSLGKIAAQRGHWAEANAYFQRVYVGYQKFLPWVAKAYIGSGESFEKMGKTQEATKTYRELLRNERLVNFSETTMARNRLAALGQG